MNGIAFYAAIIIAVILIFTFITKLFSHRIRTWQECAKKYRLNFKEVQEDKGGQNVRAFRLKGYYRTCLLSIYSTPTVGQKETIITVSYPKNLLSSLSGYPEGLLGRISKGLTRQLGAQSLSSQPFYVSLPGTAGGTITEVQREFNPVLKERLVQLMMVCGVSKQKQLEVTDAYLINKQPVFTKDPAQLFPLIDEMLSFINLLEANVDQLLL